MLSSNIVASIWKTAFWSLQARRHAHIISYSWLDSPNLALDAKQFIVCIMNHNYLLFLQTKEFVMEDAWESFFFIIEKQICFRSLCFLLFLDDQVSFSAIRKLASAGSYFINMWHQQESLCPVPANWLGSGTSWYWISPASTTPFLDQTISHRSKFTEDLKSAPEDERIDPVKWEQFSHVVRWMTVSPMSWTFLHLKHF